LLPDAFPGSKYAKIAFATAGALSLSPSLTPIGELRALPRSCQRGEWNGEGPGYDGRKGKEGREETERGNEGMGMDGKVTPPSVLFLDPSL